MRTSAAVLALAGVVAVSANTGADYCDDAYECRFYLETSSTLYKYDLSPLCSAAGYSFFDTNNPTLNATFHFNICGYSPQRCLRQNAAMAIMNGVAVQTWGDVPSCANTKCLNVQTGEQECCTQDCEVLGIDTPEFRLKDKTNPQTGGLTILHRSVPLENGDPNPCPYDFDIGARAARNVTFHMACNPDEVLKWVDGEEGPTCSYQLYLESKHACGSVYAGPGSAKSQDGLIAGMFFLGLFLGGAAIFGYWWYAGRKAGGSYFKFGGSSAPAPAASSGTAGGYGGSTGSKPAGAGMGSSSYSSVGSS